MFAANRTDSVIGRIICLTVSMSTINCDKGNGVLRGTRCLRKWLVLFLKLNIMNLIQRGNAILKVNIICALNVKMYGKRPVTLINNINIKIPVKMLIFPFLFWLLNVALSSLSIFLIRLMLKNWLFRVLCLNILNLAGNVKTIIKIR